MGKNESFEHDLLKDRFKASDMCSYTAASYFDRKKHEISTVNFQDGSAKIFKRKYLGTTRIAEIKQDMHHLTGAHVSCQNWGKWDGKETTDEMALWQLELEGDTIKQTFA